MFDFDNLERYLLDNLDGFAGPISIRKYSDGQSNPTFELKTRNSTLVLRCKPLGTLLKSAHAIEREFAVQKALAKTDVPVAKVHLLCEDPTVIGSAFYVMGHVEGYIHFAPQLLDVKNLCDVLSEIHAVDVKAVELANFGAPGNYISRQLERWSKQYNLSQTEQIPAMDRVIAMLSERVQGGFGEGKSSLVHGDYRIDNIIYSRSGRVKAVLDWELSTIGHPFADLASVIMQWRMPPGEVGRGLFGVNRSDEGLISDEEFIARYCNKSGISKVPDFNAFLGFCFFRMAAVLQGVKRRAIDGNASNPAHGIKMGEFVPEFAAKALEALNENG